MMAGESPGREPQTGETRGLEPDGGKPPEQNSGEGESADQHDALTDHGKRPFVYVRALLVAMPLAILVGSIVAPPDAFSQLLLIAATLVGGFPIAVRVVSARRYGPKQLGAFFGVVLVVVLVGLWVLGAVGAGPVPEIALRFAVVLAALLAADLVVFRR